MALAAALRKCSIAPSTTLISNLQQIRTTFVVKRRYPVNLHKPNKLPMLRSKHFVYDTIEDNESKGQKLMTILLTKYVEDIGQPGELVSVKEQIARLLTMTHKATYASKENLVKFKDVLKEQKSYSTKYAATTVELLQKFVLNISLSKENPWTLQPWHIRAAFRKAGVHVPESCFTMPEHEIKGPDMALENKEFYITVTINKTEKVTVRCRIHHWATNIDDRLPVVSCHWQFPVDPLFVDDKEKAKELPEMIPPVLDENFVPRPPQKQIRR